MKLKTIYEPRLGGYIQVLDWKPDPNCKHPRLFPGTTSCLECGKNLQPKVKQ